MTIVVMVLLIMRCEVIERKKKTRTLMFSYIFDINIDKDAYIITVFFFEFLNVV